VALRQGSHIKVATVASCWQRVGYYLGSGFDLHASRTRSERLTTCVIWPVALLYINFNQVKVSIHNSCLKSTHYHKSYLIGLLR